MFTGIEWGLGGGYPWGCSIDVCFAIGSYGCPMGALWALVCLMLCAGIPTQVASQVIFGGMIPAGTLC